MLKVNCKRDAAYRIKERRDMRNKRACMIAPVGALLLLLAAGPATAQAGGAATAEFADTEGNPVGTAEFVEGPEALPLR